MSHKTMTEQEMTEALAATEETRGRFPASRHVAEAVAGCFGQCTAEAGGKTARRWEISMRVAARRRGVRIWISRGKIAGQWTVSYGPHKPEATKQPPKSALEPWPRRLTRKQRRAAVKEARREARAEARAAEKRARLAAAKETP